MRGEHRWRGSFWALEHLRANLGTFTLQGCDRYGMVLEHLKSPLEQVNEKAVPRQARPNPLDALRRLLNALDQPGRRRVDQHRVQAACGRGPSLRAIPR